ncbi:MAG: tRNA guanosine(34) transglycosylase Tgt [Candidatus Kaiserbacteria bacterium]|nr:tRNA guanosine(34) transglycosylase Tgt [Candidatus Kaiserbacteria bacterium]
MRRPITFAVEKQLPDSLARAGIIQTPHGPIKTPAFIAVATKATAKGLQSLQFKDLGIQALIANAYHLYLTPGEKIVEETGGVGKFMAWEGPTMTDSGGFQVFSLGVGFGKQVSKFSKEDVPRQAAVAVYDEDIATEHGKLAIVDDEGVTFTSHHDGTLHRFTPERSIEIQHALGADIIFAFDEFVQPTAPIEEQRESMERTHRWAARSLKAHRQNIAKNDSQGIYGIVQGGRYEELRIESAKTLAEMDFDGYGIGGSFSKEDILGILDKVNRELPREKPRHLLGIGEPEDIFIGTAAGIDTFDCVIPTRNGRNGTVFTAKGKMSMERAELARDFSPIDAACNCIVCRTYTRAYIHHLFRAKEMLGLVLASMHNMAFLTSLTEKVRLSILDGTFENYRAEFLSAYKR